MVAFIQREFGFICSCAIGAACAIGFVNYLCR